ncbi:MAG: DUF1836 domain-containing protein [Catonella sp.]|nr:DUF1836 domain-containing protein [Catonella sp.]MDY6356793.1 DUF1836 domain-containing protein [Catonella sp.]
MTKEEKKEFRDDILNRFLSLDYIKPEDIPDIDLYMDQVTTFMDERLSSLKRRPDDKMLTKTMINNYTKNKLLPSPDKKKYSKEHMLTLIFIYYFKNILSINDIASILNPLTDEYFDSKTGDVSLEDIYSEIFTESKDNADSIGRGILHEYLKSRKTFEEEKDEKKRKFLNDFSFIAQLSFDIYVKKTIVESMIDKHILEKDLGKDKEEDKDKD